MEDKKWYWDSLSMIHKEQTQKSSWVDEFIIVKRNDYYKLIHKNFIYSNQLKKYVFDDTETIPIPLSDKVIFENSFVKSSGLLHHFQRKMRQQKNGVI